MSHGEEDLSQGHNFTWLLSGFCHHLCVSGGGSSGRDMCVSMSVCLDYTEQVKGKLSTLLQTILKSDGQEKKETS